MSLSALLTGVVLGAFAAASWQFIIGRIDTRPLFAALGKSLKSLLSDSGEFLREYGRLLAHTGTFVGWNLLALACAAGPLIAVWTYFQGHHVVLVCAYSIVCVGGVLWLRKRTRRASTENSGLGISDSQYFFLHVAENASWLVRIGGVFENRLLRRRMARQQIDRPVFIAGLARSGTTMLLELLSQSEGVATHRYRDFPFLFAPYCWNRFFDVFGRQGESVQRPHQDGIGITTESPEAYEEPIWQSFFPDSHSLIESHVLDQRHRNQEFDKCFIEHLKKLILIRRGQRYLSKGNYNVTRIEYLASLFPDARFVIPIRHPVAHVQSLVRQHELFCEYSRQDERVPHYLSAAGHFEFGPQRVPIAVNGCGKDILEAWASGDQHLGYALQWAAVYGYVAGLLEKTDSLADRVTVIRYEDFCSEPVRELERILRHVGLTEEGKSLLGNLDHVRLASRSVDDSIADPIRVQTENVAVRFGYSFEMRDS